MRSPFPPSPFRGKKASDRLDVTQSSGYSETSTVGTSSASGSRRSNPLRAFRICFAATGATSSRSGGSDEFDTKSELTTATSTIERRRANINGTPNDSTRTQPGDMTFTMADILKATRNFSPDYKIGQGGFGTVYRGKFPNGTIVAIKRAKKTMHDRHLNVEFHSEISTLECIEHLNLVRFLGYLQQNDEKIIIVEFVPNGTLREHLDYVHPATAAADDQTRWNRRRVDQTLIQYFSYGQLGRRVSPASSAGPSFAAGSFSSHCRRRQGHPVLLLAPPVGLASAAALATPLRCFLHIRRPASSPPLTDVSLNSDVGSLIIVQVDVLGCRILHRLQRGPIISTV